MTVERQHSVEFSIDAAVLLLNALKINYSLSFRGNALKTYSCILTDTEGAYLTQGHGKGIGEQSKASAIFEALEHYYSLFLTLKDHSNSILSIGELALPEKIMPRKCVELITSQKERNTLCKLYKNLWTEAHLYLPVFLSVPSYSCRPVMADNMSYSYVDIFSTNSGTAVGVTRNEALIHGINELVERHAFSLFLLNTYIRNGPCKLKLVEKESLPVHLLPLVRKAEREARNLLNLVDITTDLGVPVYFASFSDVKTLIQPSGCGCSLSKDYALERAILEALQSHHLLDPAIEREDLANIKKFDAYKKYQECVRCNLTDLIAGGQTENIQFNHTKTQRLPQLLNEYLTALTELLYSKGFEIFYTNIGPPTPNFCCVHVVIPGFEKFNLVRNGLPVIPLEK